MLFRGSIFNLILSFVFLSGITQRATAQADSLQRKWIAGGSFSFNTQLNNGPLAIYNSLGDISFYLTSARETSNTYFNFIPYLGREISRHWTLGLQLQYRFDGYKADDVPVIPVIGQMRDTVDIKQNENQYGIGLFGRYTFNPDNRFMVFLQPYASYAVTDEVRFEDGIEDEGVETVAFGVGASLGVLYELSEKFRVTSRIGLMGYAGGHWKDKNSGDESDFSSFSTNLNLSSLSFGFEFRF